MHIKYVPSEYSVLNTCCVIISLFIWLTLFTFTYFNSLSKLVLLCLVYMYDFGVSWKSCWFLWSWLQNTGLPSYCERGLKTPVATVTKDSLQLSSDHFRNLRWPSHSACAAMTYINWPTNKSTTWNHVFINETARKIQTARRVGEGHQYVGHPYAGHWYAASLDYCPRALKARSP